MMLRFISPPPKIFLVTVLTKNYFYQKWTSTEGQTLDNSMGQNTLRKKQRERPRAEQIFLYSRSHTGTLLFQRLLVPTRTQ